MSTYLRTCPPKTGWTWLMDAVAVLKKKPAEAFLFGNTCLFVFILFNALPPQFGQPLLALLSPALGFGVMLAGKVMKMGARLTPSVLLMGFSNHYSHHTKRLMLLGVMNVLALTAVFLLTVLCVGSPPVMDLSQIQNMPQEQSLLLMKYVGLVLLVSTVLSAPVLMALWFAPALVVWHDMPPLQAAFSSMVAVWRNKAAFTVYSVGLVFLMFLFYSVGGIVLGLLGLPAVFLAAFAVVLAALTLSLLVFSMYSSYEGIFEQGKPSQETIDAPLE